jgi:hypothetical protein
MKNIFLVFLICFTFLNSGCDNAFDIVVEYKEQLVVFLILDNRFDKQMIKIQKLQNLYGMPVLEKLVEPLSVRITDPLGYSRTFKDTLINSFPNFNILYVDTLNLISGVYRLFVSGRDSLYVWSNIVIQEVPQLTIRYTADSYLLYIRSSQVSYTCVKPYLLYTVTQNSESIQKSIEIPRAIDINKTDTVEFFHGMLEIPPANINSSYNLSILSAPVLYMKDKLTNYYGAQNVQFNNIKFVAYTYNSNLHEYVNSEGYSDNYSVRLDKPNYTNIIGGTGIFGSILVDSVIGNILY